MTHYLYESLKSKIKPSDNTAVDVNQMCATINNISMSLAPEDAREHYRWIYSLILHHAYINGTHTFPSHIPYDGKVMNGGKGVLQYMKNLPPILQQVLAQYIIMYSE